MGRRSLRTIKHENILGLSADFETTIPRLDAPGYKKKYKNYDSMLKNEKDYDKPQVYSGVISGKVEDIEKSETFKQRAGIGQGIELVRYNEETYAGVGISIESFLFWCCEVARDQVRMYFHNLKGFDGHYILGGLDSYNFDMVKQRKGYEKYTGLEMSSEELKYGKDKEDEREQYLQYVYSRVFKGDIKKIKDACVKYWKKPAPHEYGLVMNGNSAIYNIIIGGNHFDKNGYIVQVDIRDNLLLFPTSVEQMGKDLITHYTTQEGMSEVEAKALFSKQKENKIKNKGYKIYTKPFETVQDLLDDKVELFYLIQDAYIVGKYQDLMDYTFQHIGEISGDDTLQGFTRGDGKLTIASTAYAEGIRCFGPVLLDGYIKNKFVEPVIRRNGFKVYKGGGKIYFKTEKFYRKLIEDNIGNTKGLDKEGDHSTGESVHQHIHKCYYKGGITGPNENFRYKILSRIAVLDKNSMYPYQMSLDTLIPVGTPSYFDDDKKPFKFYKMIINEDITNPDGRPFVNPYSPDSTTREGKKTLHRGDIYYLTSIELPYFKEYYTDDESKYTLIVEMSFYQMKMNFIKGAFVKKGYALKQGASEHGNIALKTGAKLMINSEYGKDGQNNEVATKIVLKGNLIACVEVNESKYYLPGAVVTTSMARMDLIDSIGHNNKYNCYDDTDSHFIRYPDGIKSKSELEEGIKKTYPKMKLDPYILGGGDIEDYNLTMVFRRPKQYFGIGQNSKGQGIVKMGFAGINAKRDDFTEQDGEVLEMDAKIVDNLKFDDFIYGKVIPNQTTPQKIFGSGVIIDTTSKSIKPAGDYDKISEQTIYEKEDIISRYEESKQQNSERIDYLNGKMLRQLI